MLELYLHLDDLGASKTLIGFTTMVGIASEIPVFIYSTEIRKRVGPASMVFVGCIAQSMRFFGYSIITHPYWAFLLESMHGIAYGLSWSAAVFFVNEFAPPGMTTSLMGVLNGVSWGVGPLIGTLGGGFIYYHAGASILFSVFATLLLVVAGLYAWIERPFDSLNLVLVVKPPTSPHHQSDVELTSQKDDSAADNLEGEDIQIECDGDLSPEAAEVQEICQKTD